MFFFLRTKNVALYIAGLFLLYSCAGGTVGGSGDDVIDPTQPYAKTFLGLTADSLSDASSSNGVVIAPDQVVDSKTVFIQWQNLDLGSDNDSVESFHLKVVSSAVRTGITASREMNAPSSISLVKPSVKVGETMIDCVTQDCSSNLDITSSLSTFTQGTNSPVLQLNFPDGFLAEDKMYTFYLTVKATSTGGKAASEKKNSQIRGIIKITNKDTGGDGGDGGEIPDPPITPPNPNATFGAYFAFWSLYWDPTLLSGGDFEAVHLDDFYMSFYKFENSHVVPTDIEMDTSCNDSGDYCRRLTVWLRYIKNHPNTNFLISFGGYSYAGMFDAFDVSPSQFDTKQLADNIDAYIANSPTLSQITVKGIDIDFELNEFSANHNPTTNQLKNLVKFTKELSNRGYKVYLTVYSTGLDDPSNPSFPPPAHPDPTAIDHTGEMLPLFDKSLGAGYDDIIDHLSQINLMLYDAGPGYAWDTAVANAIAAVGDANKEKLAVGLAQGRQWAPAPAPNNAFMEDVSELYNRVSTANTRFGINKFFIWALGTNYSLAEMQEAQTHPIYDIAKDIQIINNLYGMAHGGGTPYLKNRNTFSMKPAPYLPSESLNRRKAAYQVATKK